MRLELLARDWRCWHATLGLRVQGLVACMLRCSAWAEAREAPASIFCSFSRPPTRPRLTGSRRSLLAHRPARGLRGNGHNLEVDKSSPHVKSSRFSTMGTTRLSTASSAAEICARHRASAGTARGSSSARPPRGMEPQIARLHEAS